MARDKASIFLNPDLVKGTPKELKISFKVVGIKDAKDTVFNINLDN